MRFFAVALIFFGVAASYAQTPQVPHKIHFAGMTLTSPSGDVALDRAAWGGITQSGPFPQLPAEFRGDYLALRFHFYYNPDSSDLQ